MSEIALRFRVAQSWWLASELARRQPDLSVIETHPGGGQYDCLTLVRNEKRLVDINRAGRIHVVEDSADPIEFDAMLQAEDPHAVVRIVERRAGLTAPRRAPASTSRVLTWRVAYEITNMTINDRQQTDVRSAFVDSSGPGGSGDAGLLERFPLAAQRATERRPDDLYGQPLYRYWVALSGDEPVAALDTDGAVYIGNNVLDLPSIYQATGGRMALVAAAVIGFIGSAR